MTQPYLHESRHLHALRRARGTGGRFLNTRSRAGDGDTAPVAQGGSSEPPAEGNTGKAATRLLRPVQEQDRQADAFLSSLVNMAVDDGEAKWAGAASQGCCDLLRA